MVVFSTNMVVSATGVAVRAPVALGRNLLSGALLRRAWRAIGAERPRACSFHQRRHSSKTASGRRGGRPGGAEAGEGGARTRGSLARHGADGLGIAVYIFGVAVLIENHHSPFALQVGPMAAARRERRGPAASWQRAHAPLVCGAVPSGGAWLPLRCDVIRGDRAARAWRSSATPREIAPGCAQAAGPCVRKSTHNLEKQCTIEHRKKGGRN